MKTDKKVVFPRSTKQSVTDPAGGLLTFSERPSCARDSAGRSHTRSLSWLLTIAVDTVCRSPQCGKCTISSLETLSVVAAEERPDIWEGLQSLRSCCDSGFLPLLLPFTRSPHTALAELWTTGLSGHRLLTLGDVLIPLDALRPEQRIDQCRLGILAVEGGP
ncbi:Protein Tamalin [Manis pentadactyla]|nr:Protein Tamalin [Manis pentadactyla]